MSDDFSIENIVDSPDDGPSVIVVTSPSRHTLEVLTNEEALFYEQMANDYQRDNSFTNVSDLAELDRILAMELMVHRWNQWIILQCDYNHRPVDPANLQKYIESYSKEIRGIKRDLGMDKSSRDKDKETSMAEYIQNLRLRAKEFGVVRNEQAIKAITLLKELQGIITLHDNSTDAERKEFKCHSEDILDWARGKFDEFDEIDNALRENQRLWIRTI